DASGNPSWVSYTTMFASAVPVFTDTIHQADPISVTFDKAIGRYIAVTDHGNGNNLERQVSMFDAPTPWGPWTTFEFEDEFDNVTSENVTTSNNGGCSGNCLGTGTAVSLQLMQKWISADGLSLWGLYSSNSPSYDSLNLVKGRLSLASGSTVTGLAL